MECTVDSVGFGGRGVARVEGRVVFVPFTLAGERVRVRVTRDLSGYMEAGLVDVLVPSPERVAPRCRHFGECGGCVYQHARYPHQLEIKTRQVTDALERIGRFREIPLHPMIASPHAYGYRNRITVHHREGATGFFAPASRRVVDVASCPIANDAVNRALTQLRARPRLRPGHHALRADPRARTFTQVNDAVAELLCALARDFVPQGSDLAIDAYCGAGMLARAVRGRARRTVGIDWSRFNIADAARLADPAAGDSYVEGDVALRLGPALDSADPTRTAVIVDPPAAGLDAAVARVLLERPVADLMYVSCNPPTLARDLSRLAVRYRLDSVTPLDMFPQTAEIEAVVHLSPRGSGAPP